jgi:hypothetical protein
MLFSETSAKASPAEDEIDWRHVWLANVAVITSEPVLPREIPRSKTPPRRQSVSLRLHKLRRLRATLSP